MFATIIKGKLTKKQEQALATMMKICEVCDGKELTFEELKSNTKLSAGALSKHLRELIRQKVIKGKVTIRQKLIKGKVKTMLAMVFIYNHSTAHAIEMEGKAPQSTEETFRFYVPKDKEKPILTQHGYTKKVKGGKKRFIPYSEPKPLNCGKNYGKPESSTG